jgi:uncharacterized protein YndB with AHSA1/START domain
MIPTETTLVLRRHYAASPERMWRLWTTAAGITSWWAPEGFSTLVDVIDLRPGGVPVWVAASFDGDLVLIPGDRVHDASELLRQAGHRVNG